MHVREPRRTLIGPGAQKSPQRAQAHSSILAALRRTHKRLSGHGHVDGSGQWIDEPEVNEHDFGEIGCESEVHAPNDLQIGQVGSAVSRILSMRRLVGLGAS